MVTGFQDPQFRPKSYQDSCPGEFANFWRLFESLGFLNFERILQLKLCKTFYIWGGESFSFIFCGFGTIRLTVSFLYFCISQFFRTFIYLFYSFLLSISYSHFSFSSFRFHEFIILYRIPMYIEFQVSLFLFFFN